MDKCDYDILKFFFEMKANTKLFKDEKVGEAINIRLPHTKNELYTKLNNLIDEGLLQISNKEFKVMQYTTFSDIKDLQDTYFLEITKNGGENIVDKFNVSWEGYCNISLKSINESMYSIIISTHPNKLSEIEIFLKNTIPNINYVIEEIKPWYPVYWKNLALGFDVAFDISHNDYSNLLNEPLNDTCNNFLGSINN